MKRKKERKEKRRQKVHHDLDLVLAPQMVLDALSPTASFLITSHWSVNVFPYCHPSGHRQVLSSAQVLGTRIPLGEDNSRPIF